MLSRTNIASDTRVTINVSGELFETYEHTLSRFPVTLLGDINSRRKHFCLQTKQYFFESNRTCFESILYFYQSNGTLSCPLGIPITIFEQECRNFYIPDYFIDSMKRKEGIFPELQESNKSRTSFWQRMWDILDNPESSRGAWYFGMASLLVVWVSIVTASLETLPSLRRYSHVWLSVEVSLNVWFLVELLLRMVFARNLFHFIKGYMNLVDIFAIIPYFVILVTKGHTHLNTDGRGSIIGLLQTLKFLRVFRLFRFSKHSKSLAVCGKILLTCLGKFRLLLLCLFIVIMLGGTVMFYAEESHHKVGNKFDSVPASLWWGIQTITTIGYGDMIPASFCGRMVACSYMLMGVTTISLPILTVVSQFILLYPKNIELQSQAGNILVGGTNNGEIQPLRPLKPIRRPSAKPGYTASM